MNLLYPEIPLRRLPAMLGIASLGALIAGHYGIAHDQVTYSLSEEYFTRLKFTQFQWANVGLPPRLFVAEIGFLAASGVGLVAGWVFARLRLEHSEPQMFTDSLKAFVGIIACAIAAASLAYFIGFYIHPQPENSGIADLAASLGVRDVPGFVRVAYIHNAGYLGAFVGITSAAFLRWRRTRPCGARAPLKTAAIARKLRLP